MTTVIKEIQQALEEQDIEKVYIIFYHRFFDHHFDPEMTQEMVTWQLILYPSGSMKKQNELCYDLQKLEPDEAIWTILLAEILVAEGETDQALSILYDIPETDPDYPSVLSGTIRKHIVKKGTLICR